MKKKMKKATAVFCTFALAMSIMGCGGKEPTGSDVQETDNTAAGTEKRRRDFGNHYRVGA